MKEIMKVNLNMLKRLLTEAETALKEAEETESSLNKVSDEGIQNCVVAYSKAKGLFNTAATELGLVLNDLNVKEKSFLAPTPDMTNMLQELLNLPKESVVAPVVPIKAKKSESN